MSSAASQLDPSLPIIAQGGTWGYVPDEALDALNANIFGVAGNGAPLGDLFNTFGPEAQLNGATVLNNALAGGYNPDAISGALAGALDTTQQRAQVIARNEMLGAYRDAQLANFRANSDVINGWMWSCAPDACMVCVFMDGSEHGLDEDMDSHVGCRCAMLPITLSWSDLFGQWGIDGEDIPETSISATYEPQMNEFLMRSAQAQQQVMGKAAWWAWQKGDIQLSDLVGYHADPNWGFSVYQRSLKEMGLDAQDYLAPLRVPSDADLYPYRFNPDTRVWERIPEEAPPIPADADLYPYRLNPETNQWERIPEPEDESGIGRPTGTLHTEPDHVAPFSNNKQCLNCFKVYEGPLEGTQFEDVVDPLNNMSHGYCPECLDAGRQDFLTQAFTRANPNASEDEIAQLVDAQMRKPLDENLVGQAAGEAEAQPLRVTQAWNDAVEKELQPKLEEYAAQHNMTVTEYEQAVNEHLQRIVDQAEIRVRMPEEFVEKMVSEGRYRTVLNGGESIYAETDPEIREQLERNIFGLKNIGEDEHIAYGYLGVDGAPIEDEQLNVMSYGNAVLHLSDDVKDRALVNFGDSNFVTDGGESARIAPEPLNQVTWRSYDLNDSVFNGTGDPLSIDSVDKAKPYAEVSIDHGFSMKDIKLIEFTEYPPSDEVKAALDRLGIAYDDSRAQLQATIDRAYDAHLEADKHLQEVQRAYQDALTTAGKESQEAQDALRAVEQAQADVERANAAVDDANAAQKADAGARKAVAPSDLAAGEMQYSSLPRSQQPVPEPKWPTEQQVQKDLYSKNWKQNPNVGTSGSVQWKVNGQQFFLKTAEYNGSVTAYAVGQVDGSEAFLVPVRGYYISGGPPVEIQPWIDGKMLGKLPEREFNAAMARLSESDRWQLSLHDFIVDNYDMHGGNFIIDQGGAIRRIDEGDAFAGTRAKQGSWIQTFGQQLDHPESIGRDFAPMLQGVTNDTAIPRNVLDNIVANRQKIVDAARASLDKWNIEKQIPALEQRLDALARVAQLDNPTAEDLRIAIEHPEDLRPPSLQYSSLPSSREPVNWPTRNALEKPAKIEPLQANLRGVQPAWKVTDANGNQWFVKLNYTRDMARDEQLAYDIGVRMGMGNDLIPVRAVDMKAGQYADNLDQWLEMNPNVARDISKGRDMGFVVSPWTEGNSIDERSFLDWKRNFADEATADRERMSLYEYVVHANDRHTLSNYFVSLLDDDTLRVVPIDMGYSLDAETNYALSQSAFVRSDMSIMEREIPQDMIRSIVNAKDSIIKDAKAAGLERSRVQALEKRIDALANALKAAEKDASKQITMQSFEDYVTGESKTAMVDRPLQYSSLPGEWGAKVEETLGKDVAQDWGEALGEHGNLQGPIADRAEAQAWTPMAESRDVSQALSDQLGVEVNVDDMHPAAANQFAQTLQVLQKDFPEVFGNMDYVGMADDAWAARFPESGVVGSQTIMAGSNGPNIAFNPFFWDAQNMTEMSDLTGLLQDYVDRGYFFDGYGSPGATLAHEMGHSLEWWASNVTDNERVQQLVSDFIERWAGKEPAFSEYAGDSDHEMFAEAFSATYYGSPEVLADPMVQDMAQLLSDIRDALDTAPVGEAADTSVAGEFEPGRLPSLPPGVSTEGATRMRYEEWRMTQEDEPVMMVFDAQKRPILAVPWSEDPAGFEFTPEQQARVDRAMANKPAIKVSIWKPEGDGLTPDELRWALDNGVNEIHVLTPQGIDVMQLPTGDSVTTRWYQRNVAPLLKDARSEAYAEELADELKARAELPPAERTPRAADYDRMEARIQSQLPQSVWQKVADQVDGLDYEHQPLPTARAGDVPYRWQPPKPLLNQFSASQLPSDLPRLQQNLADARAEVDAAQQAYDRQIQNGQGALGRIFGRGSNGTTIDLLNDLQAKTWDMERIQAQISAAQGERGAIVHFGDVQMFHNPQEVEAAFNDASVRAFGRVLTRDEIGGLVGAPEGSYVTVQAVPAPNWLNFTFNLYGPSFDPALAGSDLTTIEYSARRVLTYEINTSQLRMENLLLKVRPDLQGQGIGLRIFADEVEQLSSMGVELIETQAAGNISLIADWNGYYTWPLMGYDGPLGGYTGRIQDAIARGEVPASWARFTRIQELYETPEGRAWWKANGGTIDLWFDLRPGSESQRILQAYMRSKGLIP